MTNVLEKPGSVLGGSFLIAGTSIGAGMLALPFVTGVSGFWPGLTISFLSWLYMLCTGLLFLEVTLWMPDGSNVLSMTRRFLGRVGQWLGGLCFLFLYYCLLIAYFSGIAEVTGVAPSLVAILMLLIIFLGHHVTDRVNFVLMVGLIVTYLAMLAMSVGRLRPEVFLEQRWGAAWLAVPTLFAAYGYHNIIPTVSTYLRRNVVKLQLAIAIGTAIPFVVYAMWQWAVLNLLTMEQLATREALKLGPVVGAFSLFALSTSVLGVALSFVDFLGDGTKIPRKGWGRLLLCLMVFLPPVLFSATVPGLFFIALDYAGAFGEATLNGLLPALMVWVGRYKYGLTSERPLPGGRVTLTVLLLPAAFLVVQKIYLLIV
jgi:tyrosine-specific transport protein